MWAHGVGAVSWRPEASSFLGKSWDRPERGNSDVNAAPPLRDPAADCSLAPPPGWNALG